MFANRFLLSLTALALCLPAIAGVNIQNWETPQGTRVYFVENHDIPMLDVAVDFPAGSRFDTPEMSGLAALTHGMLDQGAGGMSDIVIAQRLADVGASLSGLFDRERAGASLRTLSSVRERDAALDVLVTVLQKPEFPQSIIQRERARMIAALREAESRPGDVAEKAFYQELYGNHGYGLPETGTIPTLSKLKRSDLQNWYRNYYRAGDAIISMMGDMTRAEAEQLALRISSGLPQGRATSSYKPTLEAKYPLPQEKRIAHSSTQSHVLLGQVAMARKDPDYFALYVGNHVLGGSGFNSRILDEVRQKRGFAYSAYSYFFPLVEPGPFVIGLQTKVSQTNDALNVARETVSKFVTEGPSSAELKQAKDNLIGGFPLRIDSNSEILGYLRAIGFYQLPLTYLDDWTKNVDAVTLDQIRDAFRRRVNPEKMSLVIVGGDAR